MTLRALGGGGKGKPGDSNSVPTGGKYGSDEYPEADENDVADLERFLAGM